MDAALRIRLEFIAGTGGFEVQQISDGVITAPQETTFLCRALERESISKPTD